MYNQTAGSRLEKGTILIQQFFLTVILIQIDLYLTVDSKQMELV